VLGEVLAQGVGEHRIDLFLVQLGLELHEELVHHAQDDVVIERLERDGRVQPIPEFRREQPLDLGALVALLLLRGEAHHGRLSASARHWSS